MDAIRLLVVPYELARPRIGVGRGPERLLESGAELALASSGANVETEVIELEGDFTQRSGGSEVDASFDLVRLVASRVRTAMREGAFPVVLSGSCFLAALGVVSGLGERSPGVVWLDAHPDFNVPETSDWGYIDAMGLAMLTGEAWQGILAGVEGFSPLPETAAVLVGAREFDEAERLRINACAINWLPPERVRDPAPLLEAIDGIEPPATGIYLHVDLDVLDSAVAPVNIYSASGGIDAGELHALVGAVMDGGSVRALSVTAYDPEYDPDGLVPPIALGLLELAASRL